MEFKELLKRRRMVRAYEPKPVPRETLEATYGDVPIVVGGSGGLSDRYRDIVAEHGLSLRHYENKVPPGARRSAGKIALVILMVGMISHALRAQVQGLVTDDAPVVYLRSASISAVRAAVAEWAG